MQRISRQLNGMHKILKNGMKTAEDYIRKINDRIMPSPHRLSSKQREEVKSLIREIQMEAYNALKSVWTYKNKAMRYLITTNIQPPFLSDWFDAENNFNAEVGMVVYDLAKGVYTTDGEKWEQIEEDHL